MAKLGDLDARRLIEAEGYLELELPAEALACLGRASPEARATALWQRMMGLAHRELDQFAAALPYLECARRLVPTDISIYITQGWCLKRLDRLGDAIAALLEADAVCRQAADSLRGRGRKRGGQEREEQSPYHALVMYNLACYYSLAGEKEKLLDWLGRALRLDPSYLGRIPAESDFDPFRADPDFQAVLEEAPFPEGLC